MHILDTGPIFKFLATDCVPQLIAALGHNVVHVPEAVEFEIMDTPKRHKQFQRAAELWPRFPKRFKRVLPDNPTAELLQCCQSVLGVAFDAMYQQRKDRGENMAILHGVLLARTGKQVILVCDEEAGSAMIRQQANVLRMQQEQGQHIAGGTITHASTLTLLRWAIEAGAFTTRTEFLTKYEAMASLDEALPKRVKETGLTRCPPWPPA